MAAKRTNDIHVRLDDEAMEALELLAAAGRRPLTEIAGMLLQDALLGRAHGLRIAAERYCGLGIRRIQRDSQGDRG